MAGTVKRWLTWLSLGVLTLVLIAGTAFAGGSSGGGGDNGLKLGNWHKNDTYTCTDGYTLVDASYAPAYDLNGDGSICWKAVDSDNFFVDDISH
jgi:hypothetical protein